MATDSFLDVARSLLEDGDAKAAFADDPEGYLASRGFEGLTADDLVDATGFVAEALPPKVAAQLGHPDSWSGDPLGRIAQLDPVPETELEPDDPEDDDGPSWDPAESGPADAGSFALLDQSVPDPGFGVGYTDDDLDDLSAPEIHDGDLPVGFELDLGDAGLLAGADHDAVDPTTHGLMDHDQADHELGHHDVGGDDDPHGHDADDHHGEHGDPLHGLDL